MKILLIVLAIVGAGAPGALPLLPPGPVPDVQAARWGPLVTIGRRSVQIDPPPDRYPANGFAHVGDYVGRLLGPSSRFRSVLFTTEAGDRASSFWSRTGRVEVAISVEWRNEPEQTYPLAGSVTELTSDAQLILEQLCGISPKDALGVNYKREIAGEPGAQPPSKK